VTITEKTNPDVEELIRYNKDGCRHEALKGALSEAKKKEFAEQYGSPFLWPCSIQYCGACGRHVEVARLNV